LSDGLLEAEDYRDGKAHAGIAESGAYIVNKHIETLKRVLEASGRDKIRLSLVGHSLGAGTAAVAAIEYNEHPLIEASSIGFGCPALLSLNLSQTATDFVTTVVADFRYHSSHEWSYLCQYAS
jgi:pimeloyl-ACP methyl ester carboxylesterase